MCVCVSVCVSLCAVDIIDAESTAVINMQLHIQSSYLVVYVYRWPSFNQLWFQPLCLLNLQGQHKQLHMHTYLLLYPNYTTTMACPIGSVVGSTTKTWKGLT